MRRLVFCSVVALALAGCSDPAPQATATADTSASDPAGITLTGVRIVLPAVKGNPGVAYFQVTAQAKTAINGVTVDGVGRSELMTVREMGKMSSMKGTKEVPVEPGPPTFFAEGGNHVMLYDLADSLKEGSETKLTVTFADGATISRPATVLAAGNR